jgi:hypothetical protein
MSLIDAVKAACDRLAPLGWRDLLKQVTSNGLDIQLSSSTALGTALSVPLASIDRSFQGFSISRDRQSWALHLACLRTASCITRSPLGPSAPKYPNRSQDSRRRWRLKRSRTIFSA